MKSHLPLVFGFVLGAAFLLLLVTFRSLVIPIKAIVLNLLSVGASYGVLTLVFQHGWGASLLGFEAGGGITSWLPLFLFVVLFGLSMDYHVFIISRIREAVLGGASTEAAVADGIKSTAGVVTSAAAVMIAVFAIFATLGAIEFKQMGVGLAAAILIDATIVRAVLLPATMKLLGDWNWYLPRGLAWLPRARQPARYVGVAEARGPRPAAQRRQTSCKPSGSAVRGSTVRCVPDWAVIRRRARPWLVLLAIAALLATISGGDSGTASAVDPVRVSPTQSARATAASRRQARLDRAVRTVLGHSAFVARGGGRKREIALTFDDGPGPYTPGVLAALNRLGVRATFFVDRAPGEHLPHGDAGPARPRPRDRRPHREPPPSRVAVGRRPARRAARADPMAGELRRAAPAAVPAAVWLLRRHDDRAAAAARDADGAVERRLARLRPARRRADRRSRRRPRRGPARSS